MNDLMFSFGAAIIVSLLSMVGIIGLILKEKILNKILIFLVSFSAGSLLGGALLHLLPEAMEMTNTELSAAVFVLLGFAFFFMIEKLLHWHHHHQCAECEFKSLPIMNLISDGFHNFIDGLLIVASFMVDFNLGLVTTTAIIFHEIPQEMSDFGVLVYGGFSRLKALLWNLISAFCAVIGVFVGYLFFGLFEEQLFVLLAVTAGGFIYVAASDLIPELNKEKNSLKSFLSFFVFLAGICLMYILKMIFAH